MQTLYQHLAYQPKNQALFEQALTHKSFSATHNERLEYIGDAVLDLVIGEALFQQCPDFREGQLSRCRADLVNGHYLAEKAKQLRLFDHLRLGTGELKAGGAMRSSILADAFEALIGALYLDAGYEKARDCVLALFADDLASLDQQNVHKDHKTLLQELLQKKHLDLPHYQLVDSQGKDHQRIFSVCCAVESLDIRATESDRTKKAAEQKAAKRLLSLLKARNIA